VEHLGDVLSGIVTILRQERFEPLIRSQIERDAEASIATALQHEWLQDVASRVKANGGQIAPNDRDWVYVDPILEKPVTADAYGETKVGPETIRQILVWVDQYAALPAEKKLDAKGMLPWPVVR
jgi:hypothetical protein